MEDFSFTFKRSTLVTIFLILIYFVSVLWCTVVTCMWVSSDPYFYIDSYYQLDLYNHAVSLMIFSLVELGLVVLTMVFYFCCKECIIFKKFMIWLTGIVGVGATICQAVCIAATSGKICTYIADKYKFYRSPPSKLLGACFKPHSDIAAVFPFYVLTHIFIFYYIYITNYFQNPGGPEVQDYKEIMPQTPRNPSPPTPTTTQPTLQSPYEQFY